MSQFPEIEMLFVRKLLNSCRNSAHRENDRLQYFVNKEPLKLIKDTSGRNG